MVYGPKAGADGQEGFKYSNRCSDSILPFTSYLGFVKGRSQGPALLSADQRSLQRKR